MPTLLDPLMMREIIMDHYENPRNRVETKDKAYRQAHMDSASCIDDIYVQVKTRGTIVEDVLWHGNSCAISTSATSIMSELAKGRDIKYIQALYAEYLKMLEGKDFDSACLGEALAFANTGRQPSRIGCATIGWRGLLEAISDKGKRG